MFARPSAPLVAGEPLAARRSLLTLLLVLSALLPPALPVSAAAEVDLWLELPQLSPASPEVGQQVTISLTVHSDGSAPIENLTLRWGVGVLTTTAQLTELGLTGTEPVTLTLPWDSGSVESGTVVLVFWVSFPPQGSAANPLNLSDPTPADAQASVAVTVRPLPTFDPSELTVGPLVPATTHPAMESILDLDLRLANGGDLDSGQLPLSCGVDANDTPRSELVVEVAAHVDLHQPVLLPLADLPAGDHLLWCRIAGRAVAILVSVLAPRGIATVTELVAPSTIVASEKLSIQGTVHNTGEGNITSSVAEVLVDGAAIGSQPLTNVRPGSSRTVLVAWTAPLVNTPTILTLTVRTPDSSLTKAVLVNPRPTAQPRIEITYFAIPKVDKARIGENITLNYAYVNRGSKDAEGYYLRFFDEFPGRLPLILPQGLIKVDIPRTEIATILHFSYEVPAGSEFGTHTLAIEFAETIDGPAIARSETPLEVILPQEPKLSITQMRVSNLPARTQAQLSYQGQDVLFAGDRIYVQATIQNTGTAEATNLIIQLLEDGEVVESRTVDRLSPGDAHTIELSFIPNAGTHRVGIAVEGFGASKFEVKEFVPFVDPQYLTVALWTAIALMTLGIVRLGGEPRIPTWRQLEALEVLAARARAAGTPSPKAEALLAKARERMESGGR